MKDVNFISLYTPVHSPTHSSPQPNTLQSTAPTHSSPQPHTLQSTALYTPVHTPQ